MNNRIIKAFFSSVAILSVVVVNIVSAAQPYVKDIHFLNPNKSIANYTNIYIRPLDLSDAKLVPPPWLDKESFRWDVNPEHTKFYQEHFKNSIVAGLTEGKSIYKIVNKEAKNVLVINMKVVSFTPYATKDNTEAMTKGSGEIRFSFQLKDGKSGELVAMYAGTDVIGKEYQPNTDVARLTSGAKQFEVWGKKVRKFLDKQHGL